MHIVEQIRIESRTDSARLARQVDRALADSDVPARLNEAFDRLAGNRTVRIECLEIDLGAMSWTEFEHGFAERVAAAVSARIQLDLVGGSPELENEARRELPPEDERLDAFDHFLRHGHLPWWFPEARWGEIASFREVFRSAPDRMMENLRILAAESPSALVRLGRCVAVKDLADAFGKRNLLVVEHRRCGKEAQALHVIAAWLEELAGGADFRKRFLSKLSARERMALENQGRPAACNETDADPLLEAEPCEKSLEPRENSTLLERAKSKRREADGDRSGVGIPVSTAGLVLLHPFLTRFFRHLGWLDDAGGMNPVFRWHAVQALQFLALGKCGLPEPTLVMEKTLCGIPLHAVADFPELDDSTRTECEHLLESVIGHWSVLGKTSVDGLRESFLSRPGLLRFEDSEIRLAVERRPYDMLLDKLPWSAGPVMFLWLIHPIQVRWREDS
jgi:hypothetical protein